jgi:hypothetical protein
MIELPAVLAAAGEIQGFCQQQGWRRRVGCDSRKSDRRLDESAVSQFRRDELHESLILL